MDEKQVGFEFDILDFTILIAMIASIKFDVGFSNSPCDIQLPFHLALQHLYCCHFKKSGGCQVR
jgi:hypothetical protein